MSVTVDCGFPGGNVIVVSSNGLETVLRKDLRDTEGDWFYWGFRAVFDAPGVYTFRFDNSSPAVGSRGPAISLDDGLNWHWGAAADFDLSSNSFRYHYDGAPENTVLFCLSMQYQEKNLNAFLKEFSASPCLSKTVLCRSRKGREVELLHVLDKQAAPKKKLFLSSRHHCCEMTATYVLEGMLREALENEEFRKQFEVFAVPFVDKDGVVDGDQGKNRRPHDHARDYGASPLYPEVGNIMKLVEKEKIDIVFDLHCPWIYQGCNEYIYFVGPKSRIMEERTQAVSAWIEKDPLRDVPFLVSDIVLYGTAWNTDANYTGGRTLAKWAAELDFVTLATSIEIPYANAREFTFHADSWRSFGRTLARAFLKFASV